ncbi:hypothetical protein NLM16_25960, partial [Bradyrhizobium brasilense]|nr:hypothetical protein [Bradyrhizobium brasilense]
DLVTLSTARFRQFIAAYNNTPRKCLDYRTPAESFAQVLHFECESTSQPSPGRHRICGAILSRFGVFTRMRVIQYSRDASA